MTSIRISRWRRGKPRAKLVTPTATSRSMSGHRIAASRAIRAPVAMPRQSDRRAPGARATERGYGHHCGRDPWPGDKSRRPTCPPTPSRSMPPSSIALLCYMALAGLLILSHGHPSGGVRPDHPTPTGDSPVRSDLASCLTRFSHPLRHSSACCRYLCALLPLVPSHDATGCSR
jgi:hypothetical protein